jgi:hypothetical protein
LSADRNGAHQVAKSCTQAGENKLLDIASEFQILDLDDQREEADIAPLGVHDPPRKVRRLANLQGSFVLAFANPASSLDGKTVPSQVIHLEC